MSNTDNISENEQLSSTAPTETSERFILSVRKVVTCLVSDLDEDPTNMPHVERLSERMENLLNEIVQELRAIRNENRSSACEVQKLQTINLHVTHNDAEAWALGIQVKRGVEEEAERLGEVGNARLINLQRKLNEFLNEIICPEKKEINDKLLEQSKGQKRLKTKQVGYENVGVPEGGGDKILAIVSAVAKPFVKMFVYIRSEKLTEELQVIQDQKNAHKAELEKIEKIERRANAAQDALGDCRLEWDRVQTDMWVDATSAVYRAERKLPITHRTQEYLDEVLGTTLNLQLRLDVQMNDLLEELSPRYNKTNMALQVERFHKLSKNISGILTQLLSIKIIRDDHEKTFSAKGRELCQILSEHLTKLRKVFVPWTIHMAQGSTQAIPFITEVTVLTREMVPFDRNVRALTGEIRTILTAETSKSKSKRAQEKRKEEDRLHETSDWIGRPLATVNEARDALQKVDDATNAMWKLSNELAAGLMYYDNRTGQDPNPASTGDRESEDLPVDPFLVSEGLVAMVSSKLSSEIINLDALARSSFN